ncbi:glycosyl hydrolase family 18 protein [Pseudoalteromonas fenneropenaei]|uniref:Glycosyl hydrolase family 18 protein n=1 Tax=Pseudoalteromonas fenneropenaei TaxID=1737459 RepID=A0ABV7CG58_9GAMM
MRSQKYLKSIAQLSAISLGLFAAQAMAVDCTNLAQWQAGQAYSAGQQVQKANYGYKANWWTQTDPETHSGQWQDWTNLGQCDSVVNNQLPEVSAFSPANGTEFNQNDSVAISVNATDADGTIAKVEFFLDGALLSTATSGSQGVYATSWTALPGSHTLAVKATDDKGGVSPTLSHQVTVKTSGPVNQAPVADLALSSAPAKLVVGSQVVFALSGSDSDGQVTQLSFAVNGAEVAATSGAATQYTWTATQLGAAQFVLTVTDDKGAVSSVSKTLTVVEDTPGTDPDACRPAGLYQTPGVNTPYCTVYDANGRELMGADHPRRIIGYFTSWRNGANGQPSYLVNDIPWDKITHINYAFAHVDGSNKVSIGDPNAANNPATNMEWPGVAGAELDPTLPYKGHFNLLNKYKKQYPDVKTLISVGGWAETGGYFGADGTRVKSGGFYTMTTNADGSVNQAGIETFAASAVSFIRQYGFDGVDIDYEYPSSMANSGHPDDFAISNARRAGLNASYQVLMKRLREELDKAGQQDGKHYMLTIASPSSGYLLRGMETFQAVQYLDYINIMSYDLHGAWNSHVGPNAALFDTGEDSELKAWNVYGTAEFEGIGYLNTDWAVRYFRGAVSAGRINIGIPYYTRGFKDVVGGTNGMWGQAKQADQNNCPPGTGEGEKNFCGAGAVGIDNLWHDKNDVGLEVPAGSNPLWHAKNLQSGIVPSYLAAYGLTPDTDPQDRLTGTYTRHYDAVAVAPWLWNDQKKVFISTEDEESMARKVDYVISNGLGGIMFWELAGDYDYDAAKGEYFMGSSLTSLAHSKFNQSGSAYNVHIGNVNFQVPTEQVDVSFAAKAFPVGDDNYPISPTFAFTNNSGIDLSGAKISFDVPVSTSAIFKSNWNAQEKLGMAVDVNGSNAAGNNIGGFENEFHRFSITLVNEWGGSPKSFAPGETVNAQVMYYMPITGPSNFVAEKDGKRYAFKFEYPQLPAAQPGTDPGTGDPVTTCEGKPISEISVYPNFPRGTHAAAGDLIIEGKAVYKAKWWSNQAPASSSDYSKVCSI